MFLIPHIVSTSDSEFVSQEAVLYGIHPNPGIPSQNQSNGGNVDPTQIYYNQTKNEIISKSFESSSRQSSSRQSSSRCQDKLRHAFKRSQFNQNHTEKLYQVIEFLSLAIGSIQSITELSLYSLCSL